MSNRRVLIVDDSPALRETISVLLGARYEVASGAPSEIAGLAPGSFDLTIAPLSLRSKPGLPPANYLWIGAPHDTKPGVLPRRFTPTRLRRAVNRAFEAPAPPSAEPSANWRFDTPFLDADAAAVISRAAGSGLSLHIRGEAGSGKHTFARSIHQQHGSGPLLICDADHPVPEPAAIEAGPTVLAVGVDRWSSQAQRALDELLAANALGVISTATDDIATLVDEGRFETELFYRLCLLRVHLVPLRERSHDIPAIASSLAAEIAGRLQRPQPTLTEAALTRLSHYMWFGNLAELEAVLTRSIALSSDQLIDVGDLLFDGTSITRGTQPAAATAVAERELQIATAETEPPAATATVEAPAVDAGAAIEVEPAAGNLDLVIQELAHELKNPLVTIKTFAQHCEQTLPAGSDEINFAKVTGQAIQRIDGTLENLLAFTRMENPALQDVRLDSILEPVFGPKRNGSGVDMPVDYVPPPPVSVRVDPEQTRYAIANLIRGLTRGSVTHYPINVSFLEPDTLLCQLPYGSNTIGEKLTSLAGSASDSDAWSIGVAIATTVLERNGAELSISKNSSPKTVMIRFPMVENEEAVANQHG